jgi:DNA-binding MarR family transcriptional regulator
VASRRGPGSARKHGHAHISRTSPTYRCWGAMIQRCTNQNNAHFSNYGGRGISVCDRWLAFANFLEDMGERPNGMTLDRIDNDGNYEPGNCRWATRKEQAGNTRVTKHVVLDGEVVSLSEAARRLNYDSSQLSKLVRRDGVESAIEQARNRWTPGKRHPNSKLSVDDVRAIKSLLSRGDVPSDIAREFSIDQTTVSAIKTGKNWSWVK